MEKASVAAEAALLELERGQELQLEWEWVLL